MNVSYRLLAGTCAALCISTVLYAGSAADAVRAQDPYARAVPPGLPNSAAFLTLTNSGSEDHALVAVQSDAAKVAEMHTHTMEGGMMRMRRVDRIDLPGGESIRLQPGGLHIMLIGLDHQLLPDETISLTLVFEDGSRETLSAPVRKVQAMMQHDHGHSH